MAWTFTDASGTSSADARRDYVRLTLGDTEAKEPQLSDAQVALCLLEAGDDVLQASILGCRFLIARFSRQVTNSKADLSVSSSDRAQHYRDLLDDLLDQQGDEGLIPSAGGTSVSDKLAAAADTDLVQPIFSVGMNDNPGTSQNEPPPGPTE